MSTKSSLFLTEDNEHCYYEMNSMHYKSIVFEMSKTNVKILLNNDEDLIIEIKPGSELYKLIEMMRN